MPPSWLLLNVISCSLPHGLPCQLWARVCVCKTHHTSLPCTLHVCLFPPSACLTSSTAVGLTPLKLVAVWCWWVVHALLPLSHRLVEGLLLPLSRGLSRQRDKRRVVSGKRNATEPKRWQWLQNAMELSLRHCLPQLEHHQPQPPVTAWVASEPTTHSVPCSTTYMQAEKMLHKHTQRRLAGEFQEVCLLETVAGEGLDSAAV